VGIVMMEMGSTGTMAAKTLVCKALDATKPCARCSQQIVPGLLKKAYAIQLRLIVKMDTVIIVNEVMPGRKGFVEGVTYASKLQVVMRACAGSFLQTALGQSRERSATKHQQDMV
jgi:hypothetical protein